MTDIFHDTIWYSAGSNGTELEHTHWSSWLRGSGSPNPDSHSGIFIYLHLSGFQSSFLLKLFCYGPNTPSTCWHYTKVWFKTYLICVAPLLRSAQPCSFTEIMLKWLFLCLNRNPIWHRSMIIMLAQKLSGLLEHSLSLAILVGGGGGTVTTFFAYWQI